MYGSPVVGFAEGYVPACAGKLSAARTKGSSEAVIVSDLIDMKQG
jgi:hypothetical protein